MTLAVRREVPPGMAVPVHVEASGRMQGNLLLVQCNVAALECDGVPAVLQTGEAFRLVAGTTIVRVDRQLAPLPAGEHRVAVRVEYELHTFDPNTKTVTTEPTFSGVAQVQQELRVLATRPAQLVRPISDPAYVTDVDVFLQSLEWRAAAAVDGWWVEAASSRSKDLSVNLAFDVEAQHGDWYAPLGRLIVRRGEWHFTSRVAPIRPDLPMEFTLNLQPSEDAALSTPDLQDYWNRPAQLGSVRLRDADLYKQVRPLTSAPATQPNATSPATP